MVSSHFAPWSFRPQSFRPHQKSFSSILEVSLSRIQELLCSIQKLLSINIFISFHSVLSGSDNLFVSTWSQMQMTTEIDVSESSPFISKLDISGMIEHVYLANRLSRLANWALAK